VKLERLAEADSGDELLMLPAMVRVSKFMALMFYLLKS
jgi:hypothetical protein